MFLSTFSRVRNGLTGKGFRHGEFEQWRSLNVTDLDRALEPSKLMQACGKVVAAAG